MRWRRRRSAVGAPRAAARQRNKTAALSLPITSINATRLSGRAIIAACGFGVSGDLNSTLHYKCAPCAGDYLKRS